MLDDPVQMISQEIRTLEAVPEGRIPLEPFGGPKGLALRRRGFPLRTPNGDRAEYYGKPTLTVLSREPRTGRYVGFQRVPHSNHASFNPSALLF